MSVYLRKGRGWKYDFVQNGQRYTSTYYKTKSEARQAEAQRKEEIRSPKSVLETAVPPTDMAFLDLVNKRLDYVKAYFSGHHYIVHVGLARRWVKKWGNLSCSELTKNLIQDFILERRWSVSTYTANREIKCLKAMFNWGLKEEIIQFNPIQSANFFPVEKKVKAMPSQEDIEKVIQVADPDTKDYLMCLRDTMGRMSEINRLTWQDVDLERNTVTLYTRKKKGGHLTPRKVALTNRLYFILLRRFENRDTTKPWVFWHRYWSNKSRQFLEGPYIERKKFMRTLCKKAGVPYFRFHAIRHAGASALENLNIPIGSIQKILGHESRQTTEIYLHSLDDSQRVAMRIFEDAEKFSHPNSHPPNKKEPATFG